MDPTSTEMNETQPVVNDQQESPQNDLKPETPNQYQPNSLQVFENDPGSPASFADFNAPSGYFLPDEQKKDRKSVSSFRHTSDQRSLDSVTEVSSLVPMVGDSVLKVNRISSARSSMEQDRGTTSTRLRSIADTVLEDDPHLEKFDGAHSFTTSEIGSFRLSDENSFTYHTDRKRFLESGGDDRIKPISWSSGSFGFGTVDIPKWDKDQPEQPEVTHENWGWVVVFASLVIMIPLVGVLSSYGTLVSSLTKEFNASKLASGLIGSLAFGFTVGLCPISNVFLMFYGCRRIALIGVFGAGASLIATSYAPHLLLMVLTYSICFGVFSNLIYNSALTLTGLYFPYKHQALATCLASSGISFGTLVFNPISRLLIEKLQWRSTLRIHGGLVISVGVICSLAFRSPSRLEAQKYQTNSQLHTGPACHHSSLNKVTPLINDNIPSTSGMKSPQQQKNEESSKVKLACRELKKCIFTRDCFDCSVCSNPCFILWMIGTLLWSTALLFPLIFLIDYVESLGIPPHNAGIVVSAYGISDFFGRIVCALGAGKIPFSFTYIYAISTFVSGIATVLTPLGRNLTAVYAFALVVGANSGVINSLMFVSTMQLFGNQKGAHVWGYANVMLATGMVGGPVAAGGIYDSLNSYKIAFYVNGLLYVVCSVIMVSIPVFLQHSLLKQTKRASKCLHANTGISLEVTEFNIGKSPELKVGKGKPGETDVASDGTELVVK